MKLLVGTILAGASCLCFAQGEEGFKKVRHSAPVVSGGPVTKAEAAATFRRVAGLFKTVLHVNVLPQNARLAGANRPVTRAEVIAEFVRLYRAAEPVFTYTPKPVHVETSRLTFDKPSEKTGLILMIERGCVGTYGPLATGAKSTISVHDFGDAVGYFLARIGDCTHVPSTKWTPYLHGNQS